jgi:DNA-binding transcriptional LysR family regulator
VVIVVILCIDILFHDELIIIAGRDNPCAQRRKVDLRQLINEPWVLRPPDGWLHPLMQKAFGGKGLEVPRATVSTLSTYAVSVLVAQVPFLTIHPETMLRVASEHRLLRALPVPLRDPHAGRSCKP